APGVGEGLVRPTVAPGLRAVMGLGTAWSGDEPKTLGFGKMEPLVSLMQETAPDKLLPILVKRLRGGLDLQQLVAAAALANARTFGGEDYIGFHTMMALAPAFDMARELPEAERPLPVLKVLYRNSNRIREKGGRKAEVLKAVEPTPNASKRRDEDRLA